MQNWNDGKAQEFKERREYVIANSHLTHNGPKAEEKVAPADTADRAPVRVDDIRPQGDAAETRTVLFTRHTCPNCRIASQYLDKAGVAYEKVIADDNADLCKQYGVRQAPTLIVTDGASFEKIAGAGAIKQYLAERA